MPLRACLTVCPWSGPAAFPFDSLHLLLSTCALLLRAVVGLLSSLQACKLSSFSSFAYVANLVRTKNEQTNERERGFLSFYVGGWLQPWARDKQHSAGRKPMEVTETD